jgi:hypothetical protein
MRVRDVTFEILIADHTISTFVDEQVKALFPMSGHPCVVSCDGYRHLGTTMMDTLNPSSCARNKCKLEPKLSVVLANIESSHQPLHQTPRRMMTALRVFFETLCPKEPLLRFLVLRSLVSSWVLGSCLIFSVCHSAY